MRPTRIIIVENEPIIAMDIEEMLSTAGLDVVGIVPSVTRAFEISSEQPADILLFDADSAGGDAALPWFGIPAVVIASRGRSGREGAFRFAHRCGCTLVTKPFLSKHLLDAVACVLQQQSFANVHQGTDAFSPTARATDYRQIGGNNGISRNPTISENERVRLVASG